MRYPVQTSEIGRALHREMNTFRKKGEQVLTSREREILGLIVDGKSHRQIAAQLKLSVNTVRVHRANIMAALGIHKSTQLVVYAIRTGLVVPPGHAEWEQQRRPRVPLVGKEKECCDSGH